MTSWRPDPSRLDRPAYLSLAGQFARAIESGVLPAGTRLPPHRKLADELGLSVQTVSRAYDELTRRGLVSGEVGRGSFVLPAGQEARQPYLPERSDELIDLSILKPACDLWHLGKMREGFAWLAENLSAPSALSFRPNIVMPRHRAVAAGWLARGGIRADPADICITNGATSAITASVMSVAPPGTAIAAEMLTHHTLMPLCGYLGVQIEGIAMDEEGMLPAALDEAARRIALRAVYLQPTVINPIAALMPEARRAELVEVARRHDLAIIENDVLNVMVEARPTPLAALAPERTLHINGFTKITLPGLRVAYLVSPPRYSTAVANRHLVSDWMATPSIVELLSHWLSDGTAEELIAWQRAALGERHRVAAQVLGPLSYRSHPQGLHLWMPLPEGRNESEFVAQARLRGVAVAAGSAFRSTKKGQRDAIRIAVGATGTDELRRGLSLVSSLLEDGAEVPLPTP
jgi:DNA-binding transcriptional MocR family regulator